MQLRIQIKELGGNLKWMYNVGQKQEQRIEIFEQQQDKELVEASRNCNDNVLLKLTHTPWY